MLVQVALVVVEEVPEKVHLVNQEQQTVAVAAVEHLTVQVLEAMVVQALLLSHTKYNIQLKTEDIK
jgi:hypothetical protein